MSTKDYYYMLYNSLRNWAIEPHRGVKKIIDLKPYIKSTRVYETCVTLISSV